MISLHFKLLAPCPRHRTCPLNSLRSCAPETVELFFFHGGYCLTILLEYLVYLIFLQIRLPHRLGCEPLVCRLSIPKCLPRMLLARPDVDHKFRLFCILIHRFLCLMLLASSLCSVALNRLQLEGYVLALYLCHCSASNCCSLILSERVRSLLDEPLFANCGSVLRHLR